MLPGSPTSSTAPIGIASCHLSRIERVGGERERGQEHRRDDVDVPAVARAFRPGAVREEQQRALPRTQDTGHEQEHEPAREQRERHRELPERRPPPAPAEQHEEPAEQHEREREADARHVPETRERGLHADADEPQHLPGRLGAVLPRVLARRARAAPRAGSTHRKRHGVEQRDAPTAEPAAEQHREADDRDHRDRDARAHQAREPGEQPEPVAPRDRAVVVGEQQVREPEHERAHEGDLERDEDVLRARAEEHEHRGRDRREPRVHPGAPHHDEEQRRRDEVQHAPRAPGTASSGGCRPRSTAAGRRGSAASSSAGSARGTGRRRRRRSAPRGSPSRPG